MTAASVCLVALVGLPCVGAGTPTDELRTRVLYAQDFESAKGEAPPAPIRDNSGWAGGRVPLRVADSGDARRGRVLTADVSGFCQLILGRVRGLEKGAVYRVSLDIASRGMQRPTVLLRKGRSPYTAFLSSEEATSESWRRVTFLGRSLHDEPGAVLLMLIMTGVTTLELDNLRVEQVLGDLPPGAPPEPGNQTLNSSFELGSDGWFVRGDASFPETADAFEGRRTAVLEPKCLFSSAWLRLSRQADYLVRARIRSRNGQAACRLGVGNYVFPRGGSAGKAQTFAVKTQDGWKTVGFRWRPPVGGKITRWAEFYLSIRNTGRASLLLDGVEVRAVLPGEDLDAYAPAAPLELAVSTDAPQNVATRGEPVRVTVLATADRPRATLQILDEQGIRRQRLALEFRDRKATLVLADLPCGYWRLTTAPTTGAAKRIEGETLLAVVPAMPDVPIAHWTYGVHVPRSEAVRDACWKLGLRWDRFHDTCKATKWRVVQPKPDVWAFDDATVRLHGERGHGLMGSLATLPAWAPKVDKQGRPVTGKHTRGNRGMVDATLPPWREYARRCAAHWKGAIDVWEVTNEPNLSGMPPAEYVRLLEAAYRGVKQGHPKATVVGLGGVAPANSPWALEAVRLGAPRFADVLSFHGYGACTWSCTVGPEKLIATVKALRQALAEAGAPKMPLWDSECGVSVRTSFTKFHIPHGGDPDAAACMFPKSVAAVRAAGLARVFYYSAATTTHAGDDGLRWLSDFNGVVKRPAVPLAVAVSLLEGTRYMGASPCAGPGLVALAFESDAHTVHMIWRLEGERPCRLPAGCRRVVNMWGRDIAPDNGRVPVNDEPVYAIAPRR